MGQAPPNRSPPPLLSWRAHGVFSGQIRLWTRVNMCTRGLGDGIRVLTTYGPSFLSSIPAVSTGTMGPLLQTGKLMNILGVKCFYGPLPFTTLLSAHMEVFVINLLPEWYFLQCSDLFTYIQEQFGTSFQTQWYHPPRFLPCWHDKRGQSLIPELCYEGDSGVNTGWRATQERNVWTSAGSKGADRKLRAVQ